MRAIPDASLALRCRVDGIAALRKAEQTRLRDLFQKEVRKGAFLVPDAPDAAILNAFCEHLERSFDGTELHVIDFRPLLRRRARVAAKSHVPVTALLLYATWIEHWLNMMITVARLRNGDSAKMIEQYFAQHPRSDLKLVELEETLGFGPVPMRDEMKRLIKLRNDVVHYDWRGDSRSAVTRFVSNIRNVSRRGDRLLAALSGFESKMLDLPALELGRRLFPNSG